MDSGIQPGLFVSHYFRKKTVASAWSHEIYGIGIFGAFTQKNNPTYYISDRSTKRGKGPRQTRRIRNAMDESEVAKMAKRCSQCGVVGHNYKRCPNNEIHDDAEAGPSGNPTDGAPPDFVLAHPRRSVSSTRARPRRSVSSRLGLF
jgi:hypothetical protein